MAKNIYQKMAAVMEEVKYVQKTGYNGHFKYSYAKESDYIESIRPALLKNGLICYPSKQTVSKDGEITNVEMVFTIVNIDNPEEKIEVPSAGQGHDKSDKGVYKAITGAKKYFLSTAFLIETGDDAEATDETGAYTGKVSEEKQANIEAMAKARTLVPVAASASAAPTVTKATGTSQFRRMGAKANEAKPTAGSGEISY